MQSGLPQILSVGVLQLADVLHGGVVQKPHGILAIGTVQRVEQVNQLVGSDGGRGSRRDTKLTAARGIENTCGLAAAVAGEERLFLLVADTTGELGAEVVFQVKGRVVQKLLGHLDHGSDLVCADELLTESIVAFGDSAFLIDPSGSALGGDDGDLVAAGRSGNDMSQASDHILCGKRLHQRLLKFVGNEVAALTVHAFLQSVADLCGQHTTLGTGLRPERLLIGVGSTAGLGVHLCRIGLLSDGRIDRSVQLTLESVQALLTLDLTAEIDDLLFHLLIGGGVLSGEDAFVTSVGVEERLRLLPGLCTLCAQFVDLTHCLYPP